MTAKCFNHKTRGGGANERSKQSVFGLEEVSVLLNQ